MSYNFMLPVTSQTLNPAKSFLAAITDKSLPMISHVTSQTLSAPQSLSAVLTGIRRPQIPTTSLQAVFTNMK